MAFLRLQNDGTPPENRARRHCRAGPPEMSTSSLLFFRGAFSLVLFVHAPFLVVRVPDVDADPFVDSAELFRNSAEKWLLSPKFAIFLRLYIKSVWSSMKMLGCVLKGGD